MSRRLRVLEVITSLAGGAGLHAVELARRLDPQQFDVTLAFGPGYPLDQVVRQLGLQSRTLRWPRALHPWRTLVGTLDLARFVGQGRFDLVHAHCSLAGAVARPLARAMALAGQRMGVVFTVHAFAAHDHQRPAKHWALNQVERALDSCTDRYVVTTARYRDELQRRGIAQANKIVLIPLGIPVEPVLSRAEARQRLDLPDDDEVVMFSGRLEPQKGLAVLLQAWPRVLQQRPNARLVLLGDGPLRPELQALAADLPRVHFALWRDDAAALLVAADLFCLPSLWEAFGYVLLEAMAAGVPIVASRVGGVPEVLEQGRWGRLCEPGSAAALAQALVAGLVGSDAQTERCRQAQLHVRAHHGVQHMVGAHASLYHRMAEGSA